MSPRRQAGIVAIQVLIIFSICAGILVTDVNRIRHHNTGDFQHFFYAADAVYRNQDPYAAWTRGYIYPPLIAFAFQPLAPLGIDRAAGVMLAINVMVTLLAITLASYEFLNRLRIPAAPVVLTTVILLGLLLNIDKVKGEWQMWQTDVFMLLLFVLALRWLDRFPIAAGMALGIAVNIKYLPLMFIPYLLIRRRWKTTIGLIVGTILFAILPALSTGWTQNLRNWNTATNGLLQMTGIHTAVSSALPQAAEVHSVKDSLSCSITSSFARLAGPGPGFAIAAITAGLTLAIAIWMYRKHNRSIFQTQSPQLVGTEWVLLVAAVLVFGPQTNTRHLFDALIFTTAAAAMLLFANPATPRLPLILGTTILFLGFILPPGSRTVIGERTPTIQWIRIGGPAWCLLIAAMTLLWTALKEQDQTVE